MKSLLAIGVALLTWAVLAADLKDGAATDPRLTAKPFVSEPVRSKGLEFKAVVPPYWRIPAAGKKWEFPLELHVTNKSDAAVTLPKKVDGLQLKDAEGHEIVLETLEIIGQAPPENVTVGKGETAVFKTLVRLSFECVARLHQVELLRLWGATPIGLQWQSWELSPGKYTVSLAYSMAETEPFDAKGGILTPALGVEIFAAPDSRGPDLVRSEAAVKNGVEYRAIVPRVWLVSEACCQLPFQHNVLLEMKNATAAAVSTQDPLAFELHLTDEAGKEVQWAQPNKLDAARTSKPAELAPGAARESESHVRLEWNDKLARINLDFSSLSTSRAAENLKPGKYMLRLSQRELGITTPPVPIEIKVVNSPCWEEWLQAVAEGAMKPEVFKLTLSAKNGANETIFAWNAQALEITRSEAGKPSGPKQTCPVSPADFKEMVGALSQCRLVDEESVPPANAARANTPAATTAYTVSLERNSSRLAVSNSNALTLAQLTESDPKLAAVIKWLEAKAR